jgi:GTP diphosphokinase / guanosine-3',5'-bis(diphosphate) 3'-diphosphatase
MDYGAATLDRIVSSVWRTDDFGRLMGQLERYLPSDDLPSISAAYEFSAKAHQGQQRRNGDPYISHPVAVAEILAGLHLDSGSIKAALLHDVVEDTANTLPEIQQRFGDDVALLVDGVSKIDHLRFDSVAEAQAESFRKMLLAMAKDLRVILVKLADRTHNMRTIQSLPVEKQRRIARETLDIYAPIANRLGVYSIKLELEDLGFKTFYPYRYKVLERSLRRAKGNQRQLLRKIESKLTDALADAKISARVVAREKHLYSIYLKMQRKQAHLSDIVDVYGVRVIVDDVDNCYRALGITHQLFKPMPGRFKDYISIPRVNGYQSLHTTLFGPNGLPLEVQLRTEGMEKVAERGIAAHWQYKALDKDSHSTEERAREWLAGLMEMERAANSEEFLETVKADLFPDKVYVFTPKGAIMRLPRGATAVDFAYAVHTDVGNRCVAAKIDRRAVPLKTQLQNGETVEIVTQRGAHPNPSWVNFVTTAKARNAIRGYLKGLKRDEAQELGRRLINQELLSYSLSLKKVPKARLEQLLKELAVADEDALLEQVGLGERLAPVVAGLIAQERDERGAGAPRKPLEIAGTEGSVVSYAHCCYPIPGDEIVGFMSSGRGIVIHRDRCRNLAEYRKQPAKWIPVNWTRGIKADFESEIQVRTLDRVGLLAEVAGRISAAHTNIEHVRVDRDGDASALAFRLKVRDRRQLAQVVRSIRTIPGVVRVSRSAS